MTPEDIASRTPCSNFTGKAPISFHCIVGFDSFLSKRSIVTFLLAVLRRVFFVFTDFIHHSYNGLFEVKQRSIMTLLKLISKVIGSPSICTVFSTSPDILVTPRIISPGLVDIRNLYQRNGEYLFDINYSFLLEFIFLIIIYKLKRRINTMEKELLKLPQSEPIILSKVDFDILIKEINDPSEPNECLKDMFKEYKRLKYNI